MVWQLNPQVNPALFERGADCLQDFTYQIASVDQDALHVGRGRFKDRLSGQLVQQLVETPGRLPDAFKIFALRSCEGGGRLV